MPPADRRSPAPPPPRLADGRDPLASALREVRRRALPTAADEGDAWRRLAVQQAGRSGPRLWRVRWWAAGAALAAAALVAAQHARRPMPTPVAPSRGVALVPELRSAPGAANALNVPDVRVVPRAPVAPALPRLALGAAPRLLPPGSSRLADEAAVEIAPATSARASADPAVVRVIVDWGEVQLHVEKRVPGGPGFEVAAGPYRFRVLGTKFRVVRRPLERGRAGHVELWVEEGRVAVWRGRRSLGVVEAGGHWSGVPVVRAPLPAPAPPPPAPAPEARPATSRAECAALAAAADTAAQAVSCYLARSSGAGADAETALYEVARLRRDALRDQAGALAAFRLYRARFPRGMLRAEADLSIVELLPKLNRHREALEEIGLLLADARGTERAAELHFLRANIYREVLEDFGSAERDYAAVEAAGAPQVGDATFFRGVCLQALGRVPEARASLQRYLGSGSQRFADEARRRLARLAR